MKTLGVATRGARGVADRSYSQCVITRWCSIMMESPEDPAAAAAADPVDDDYIIIDSLEEFPMDCEIISQNAAAPAHDDDNLVCPSEPQVHGRADDPEVVEIVSGRAICPEVAVDPVAEKIARNAEVIKQLLETRNRRRLSIEDVPKEDVPKKRVGLKKQIIAVWDVVDRKHVIKHLVRDESVGNDYLLKHPYTVPVLDEVDGVVQTRYLRIVQKEACSTAPTPSTSTNVKKPKKKRLCKKKRMQKRIEIEASILHADSGKSLEELKQEVSINEKNSPQHAPAQGLENH